MNNKDYQRGYAAGRKRVKVEAGVRQVAARRAAFRQRAFLAALPSVIEAQGWVRGDKPIATLSERVALAREFADEAVKQFF